MSQLFYFILIGIVAFYGILIGSFLNVCIVRIPNKESIVHVSSHCMNCNTKILWYDLIPIFSFLRLGGRCRTCGATISPQYPLIEAMNGFLYVLVFWTNGFRIESAYLCVVASVLLVISMIDLRTMEIPISLNVFLFFLGFIHLIFHYHDWSLYFIGFFAASSFLFLCLIITKGKGIGGGDIKLMAVAGLCIGWQNILLALALGSIIGSIIQVLKILITKKGYLFAFGPYLSTGIFIAMLWGDRMISWYIGFILHFI